MFLLNLFFLSIYLTFANSLNEISSGNLNENLAITMQNILCSTDSNSIDLLAKDRENFYETGELIKRLNEDCSFKTVRLSSIDTIETTLQNHSDVIVFIINSGESTHYFLQAVARYKGSNSRSRFLVVFQWQYDLQILESAFMKLSQKTKFNIVVILHYESNVFIYIYDTFDAKFRLYNDTRVGIAKDIFVINRSDLRGRRLVVSMHEQIDRAVLKKNGEHGYAGVDGLIAELLENRYFFT